MAFNLVKLSQRDPRWKDDKLGTSSLSDDEGSRTAVQRI